MLVLLAGGDRCYPMVGYAFCMVTPWVGVGVCSYPGVGYEVGVTPEVREGVCGWCYPGGGVGGRGYPGG